ncbi:unnamed protein product [Symbiodinium pilosum]|uniref:Uncharacterized protein n=1 Tax=Symbiodinium pilosum TaxID=2952 RepID=A0A812PZW6_SYMPI|nr:unnamed protein product [Symbiodinium pilosum]
MLITTATAPPLYADQVLEISTSGKGNRLIGSVIGNGEAKYACAALGPDNRIYCAPLEAHRVLLITPEDHEVEEIGIDLGKEEEKYSCIAAAPAGHMMYAAPRNARFILEVDTKRCYVREVGKDLGPVKRKFTAIVSGKPPEAAGVILYDVLWRLQDWEGPAVHLKEVELVRGVLLLRI